MTNTITSLRELLHSGAYSTATELIKCFPGHSNDKSTSTHENTTPAHVTGTFQKNSEDCSPTCLYCSEFKKGESPANTTVLQGMWMPSAKVPVAATT